MNGDLWVDLEFWELWKEIWNPLGLDDRIAHDVHIERYLRERTTYT